MVFSLSLIFGYIFQFEGSSLVTIASGQDIFPLEFTINALVNDEPKGKFNGPKLLDLICKPHTFRGLLESSSTLKLNWTFSDSLEENTNVTFQLKYRKMENNAIVYRRTFVHDIIKDCRLWLMKNEASVTWKDYPKAGDCQTWFPGHEDRRGVAIVLLKLNVPCSRGYLHFTGLNTSQHQYIRSHKQAHLCGKLEELSDSDRHIYFPSSHTAPFLHLHGNPMFGFSYKTVDYCYNMTFVTRNGSFELKPSENLECTFKIYLPYGNRVALTLQIGDSTSTGIPDTDIDFQEHKKGNIKCEGLLTQLLDGESARWHCTRPGDAEKQIQILSRENKVVLRVSVRSSSGGALSLRMFYKAEPIDDIVGRCGFSWVALRQFCISAFESSKLPWAQAEIECTRKGGHLISIRNEHAQTLVNNLLLNR
ncbi:hypothetical protein FQR65_LT13379 [Abscondita terminalis]|nr:hypothetical protein FQR65_LT13379 [Abscondita terminalis]